MSPKVVGSPTTGRNGLHKAGAEAEGMRDGGEAGGRATDKTHGDPKGVTSVMPNFAVWEPYSNKERLSKGGVSSPCRCPSCDSLLQAGMGRQRVQGVGDVPRARSRKCVARYAR